MIGWLSYQYFNHPWYERFKVLYPCTMCGQHDDGYRQIVEILLVLDVPVGRNQSLESVGCRLSQQVAIVQTGRADL